MTNPTDRGPTPTTKARFKDEFEFVAFRHMEFRRTSNPTSLQLKAYEPIIVATSANFFRKSKNLCMDHMMDIDDLKTYATMWTVNYIGLYELPPDTGDQNFKLLRTYLSQRFNELRGLLWKKGRNIFVHYDEASIAFTGKPYNTNHNQLPFKNALKNENLVDWFPSIPFEEPESVDKKYLIEHRGYKTNSVLRRRQLASQKLQYELSNLSHEDMVQILSEAADNIRIHPDAQTFAREKLQLHKTDCNICSLGIEKNEQMSRI